MRPVLYFGLPALLAAVAASALSSCAQTPPNVPVRTFERAERMDVVCMRVVEQRPDGTLAGVAPEPVTPDHCGPVPPGVSGATLPYHLYSLVTQTTRGELAVVDMTAGAVVDLDRATPGINFLPVGSLPSDVAVAPDGRVAFVASAEPNKAALYAIRSDRILGNAHDLAAAPAALSDWPSCALPQSPSRVFTVPRKAGNGYDVVALLPGDAAASAKVVRLDPTPMLRGAGLDSSPGAAIAPGSLAPCAVSAAVELAGAASVPAQVAVGPSWSDGVSWIDGGVTDDCRRPRLSAACGEDRRARCCAAGGDGGAPAASDGGAAADGGDAGALDTRTDPDPDDECIGAPSPSPGDGGAPEPVALDLGILDEPRAGAATLDGRTLFVADHSLPLVHRFDLESDDLVERPPLVLSSLADPGRVVVARDLAVSPTTSDLHRYLYAVDRQDGSIAVFDVTDPILSPTVPLTRPHPELNPFQPLDRIVFGAPVVAVSFARHDFVLQSLGEERLQAAKTGLRCNPNTNVNGGGERGPFVRDPGAYYRDNAANQEADLGPFRLRGVFGFATLASGQIVTLDVDDWDAPCRRPDPMGEGPATNSIAPAQPLASSPDDIDPYHAPSAFVPGVYSSPAVSVEAFFPVSAPHRSRSSSLLRKDPSAGIRIPNLPGLPQLVRGSAVLPTQGLGAEVNPVMLPAATTLADPTYVDNPTEGDAARRVLLADPYSTATTMPGRGSPGVRMSWEDPTVHIDQDWTVTYEGALPGFDGLIGALGTTDGHQTATLSNASAFFCRRGVEDFAVGAEREALVDRALVKRSLPASGAPGRTADYVQIVDEILPATDPYWAEDGLGCWDPSLSRPEARHAACSATYGAAIDESLERDFPVIEAYEDRLVLGRFGYPDPGARTTATRVVVGADPSNAGFLARMRCCFHNQVRFRVRPASQWLATGSVVGYLHHLVGDAAGRCVQSCAPRESLLNARAPAVPRPTSPTVLPPGRNSPLALRNPMMSLVVWNGVTAAGNVAPSRDMTWRFALRGQFNPLLVDLARRTTAVNPQSMRFIEPLGQVAIVDGSSQGLVLINLDTVELARDPYF